jgi:hypothetical protein
MKYPFLCILENDLIGLHMTKNLTLCSIRLTEVFEKHFLKKCHNLYNECIIRCENTKNSSKFLKFLLVERHILRIYFKLETDHTFQELDVGNGTYFKCQGTDLGSRLSLLAVVLSFFLSWHNTPIENVYINV